MMGENAMDSVGALPLVLHDSLKLFRPSIECSSNFINTSGGGYEHFCFTQGFTE